jgi:hypothetical protein
MREQLQRERTWGFRFSVTDPVALASFGVAIAVLCRLGSSLFSYLGIFAGRLNPRLANSIDDRIK